MRRKDVKKKKIFVTKVENWNVDLVRGEGTGRPGIWF